MKKPPQDHTSTASADGSYAMRPIAIAHSPYRERFGAPHQAATVRGTRARADAEGSIELLPHVPVETLLHLEGFDYVWAIYVFHLNRGYRPTVKPPRTPDVAHGVLATRAPHRPNPIGLSALRLVRIEGRVIHVRGIDLLDGTPVLDLKPYLPYADAFPDASAGWVDEAGGSPERERDDAEPWDT
ncbi:MAG: tRNA (N6-threonylcarbamoyladenosine(37)-N6)-methyltransferase TrmO [Sandaracinus sp.]